VAIAPGATDFGQSVFRSESCSWMVAVEDTIVETSVRSRAMTQSVVCGPRVCEALFTPAAVGTSMYTEGYVKV